jgi:hypothetical protein
MFASESARSPEKGKADETASRLSLAILSNGTPEMLESAVRHNALESSFD